MANHWAIAIGINQYHHLPPLRYARQDARALRNFLVNEVRLPPNHCWLFTDAARTVTEQEALAQPEAILACLQQLALQVQPDDRVWCFFSGYGLCQEQTDYLVPIAGDPDHLADTAIPVRALLETLAALPTQQVLLLLDMSRSQEAIALTTNLGAQTAALAGELGIATLLSCCPGQVSHEVANVGHGLFTEALLGALRQPPPLDLQTLDQFLRDRLPELCRTHRQPLQNPFVIVPPDRFSQIILERSGQPPLPPPAAADFPEWEVPPPLFVRTASPQENRAPEPPLVPDPLAAPTAIVLPPSRAPRVAPPPTMPSEGRWSAPSWDPLDALSAPPRPLGMPPHHTDEPTAARSPASPSPMPSEPPINATDPVGPSPVSDRTFWGRFLLWGGAAVFLLIVSILARNWAALNMPADPLAVVTASPGTASPNPTPEATLTPLPPVSPPLDPEALRHTNQIVLTAAEGLIAQAPYQASSYSKAIALASKIQPGEPLYEEAQIAMEMWSREIMTIARERAAWGNRQQAIAAARLVPPAQAKVYAEAQAAIAQWQ